MSTFSLDELDGLYTERSLVAEANARATVRTDNYQATIKQVSPREADEKSPYAGRKTVTLSFAFVDGDGKPGSAMQDVSWEVYRELQVGGERLVLKEGDEGYDTSLKLDKPTRLWAQVEKIFNPNGEFSIPEVLKAAMGSEVEVYIMEGFMPEGGGSPSWIDAKPNQYGTKEDYIIAYDAQRASYAKLGLIPKNFLVSIRKVKQG